METNHFCFVVMLEEPLSEYQRKVLTNLYMPIMGNKALAFYNVLAQFVEYPLQETSLIPVERLLVMMNIKSCLDFLEERQKLEALGLLDTYVKTASNNNEIIIYNLKKPLNPESFFKDPCLSQILRLTLGKDYYETLLCDFLLRKWDLSTFKKVTASFDDIYEIDDSMRTKDYTKIYLNNNNEGVYIKNEHFDVKYYIVLVGALDILKEAILTSNDFLNIVNRYSFFYQLNADEMKDATICSVNLDKEIDYDKLAFHVKRIYDSLERGIKVKAKSDKMVSTDATIRVLETTSPLEIVKNKYKTPLTSAEVMMFDRLLKETGIGLGILNVLIIYVLEEKNGEIPTYNYFLTIINRWIRAGVKTTQDAIDFINGRHASQQKKKQTTNNNKKTIQVPEWYDEYAQNAKNGNNSQPEDNKQKENINDLEDFFKPKK